MVNVCVAQCFLPPTLTEFIQADDDNQIRYLEKVDGYGATLAQNMPLYSKLRLVMQTTQSKKKQAKPTSAHASMLVWIRVVTMQRRIWKLFCDIYDRVEVGRTKGQKGQSRLDEYEPLVIPAGTRARQVVKLEATHLQYIATRYEISKKNIEPWNVTFIKDVWHCNLTPHQMHGLFEDVLSGGLSIATGKTSEFYATAQHSKNLSFVSSPMHMPCTQSV